DDDRRISLSPVPTRRSSDLLLRDHAGIAAGAALHLIKRLPVAAGIGGGSSDAAAAMLALRRFWRLSLDDEALCDLGASLGADVPACLYGRAGWVRVSVQLI